MDQHQLAFIEEAKELLPQLEEALLELESDPTNDELINSVFRALHTIKGSGGMFGFETIEHFTHDLENAFELVRSGSFPASRELIDLTLKARDEIHLLVHVAEEGLPDDNQAFRDELIQQLKVVLSDAPTRTETQKKLAESIEEDGDPKGETFHIYFKPDAQSFCHGSDPVMLLNELRELGDVKFEAHVEDIPLLDNLIPESCYVAWDITLTTTRGENAIQDVFIFVDEESDLKIEKDVDEQQADIPDDVEEPEAPAEPEKKTKPAKKKSSILETQNNANVRVPAERLDKMVNLVGELVIAQARLSQLCAHADPEVATVVEELERLSADMRDTTMSMRMVPIGSVFGKYKRLVRDLARDLGKEVDIETAGGETELDKTVIEKLYDPMVHLIRNAIDHGIEDPATRTAEGKPSRGRIHLSATHSGAYVLVAIRDDGAGLDRDKIFAKAVERGFCTADAELSDREIFDFILQAGFSTKEQVSSLSGRGVGMDVVARGIQQLGGRIQIDSERGRETVITLRLPLTLAIIDGLQVQCDGGDFVIPVGAIEECVEMTDVELERDRYRRVLNLRGEMVPYVCLRELFDLEDERPAFEKIVIIHDGENRFGIVVDIVVGELQAVIKPLGKLYRDVAEISGATILGDGTVALILDLNRFVEAACKDEAQKKGGVK